MASCSACAKAREAEESPPGQHPIVLIAAGAGTCYVHNTREREAQIRAYEQRTRIPVPPEKIAEAKTILRGAIERLRSDETRTKALSAAHTTFDPRDDAPCPLPATTFDYPAVMKQLGITSRVSDLYEPDAWPSHELSELQRELSSIDQRVFDKTISGIDLGESLVRDAKSLADPPEPPRYDFQFVVERNVDPSVAAGQFMTGAMVGTVFVYDRTQKAVVCAAPVRGQNSDHVSYVAKSNDVVVPTEDPGVAVQIDLMRNTLNDLAPRMRAFTPKALAPVPSSKGAP